MLKDKKLLSLGLFYLAYFFAMGVTSYAGKLYGEIGLNDFQIGVISAVPAFVALFAQPVWGSISDRATYKKNVMTVALVCAAGFAFLVRPMLGWFAPLLAVLTLMNTSTLPVLPVGNAVTIEYTRSIGKEFGPVRMTGSVGYLIIILAAGFLFTGSLENLYNVYGALLLVTALVTRFLPPVQGYQHGKKEKTSFTAFFRDKSLLLMFCLIFCAQMCNQFSMAFFSKHLGDLGMSNSTIGIITTLTLCLEVPFLLFGDKIMKKLSIWKWMWIGLLLNSIRYLALSFVTHPALIVIAQMMSVTTYACFEFFPVIHFSRAVPKELSGSVQNTFNLIAFGAGRIVGTLLGGAIANMTGIPTVFAINGSMLLVVAIVMTMPLLRRAKADATML